MNRPFGDNILIVPNEVHLLPDIAMESVEVALAQVIRAIDKPVRAENPNFKLCDTAGMIMGGGRVAAVGEGVDEGGAVVPLEVIDDGVSAPELVANDVEVATVGPVVPEVDHAEGSGVVNPEESVELGGPWSRNHRRWCF